MFKILQKAVTAGISTVAYPDVPAVVSAPCRGAPEFDFVIWHDARPAADLCPAGAIALSGDDLVRRVTVDYGRCIFCGLCAELSPDGAVRVTTDFELANHNRQGVFLKSGEPI